MLSLQDLITGGGGIGLVASLAYAWRQWRASRREDVGGPVSDVATANAALLASLQEERTEGLRLSGRVEDLENQNALLYERLRDQRREYEAEIKRLRSDYEIEIGNLRDQVDAFRAQLDDLQRRLSGEPGGK